MAAAGHRLHRAAKSSIPSPAATATATAKASAPSRRLHGFSFPTLSWGAHRLLRCSKDGAPATAPAPVSPPQNPKTPSLKEKPAPTLPMPTPQQDPAGDGSRPQRPMNLRPRRYYSATAAAAPASRSDGGAAAAQSGPAAPLPLPRKRSFAVALTREEIAEDFAAIRCPRPARRGKKRPKQNEIDKLFPGTMLLNVDPDAYKIGER